MRCARYEADAAAGISRSRGPGLAVIALWTGSLTPLSVLVVDIVLLWALATARHAVHVPGRPVAT
jgi:hypothetical protein